MWLAGRLSRVPASRNALVRVATKLGGLVAPSITAKASLVTKSGTEYYAQVSTTYVQTQGAQAKLVAYLHTAPPGSFSREQDHTTDFERFAKAAEQGDAAAQCGLALCYENGCHRGVTRVSQGRHKGVTGVAIN